MNALSLAPTTAAALLDLPERQVRKEAEHGFFGPSSPPRLDFSALVYLRLVGFLGLDLGVEARRQLHRLLVQITRQDPTPETVEWLPMLTLHVGPLVREVTARVEGFEHWRATLVTDPDILGGETVFPGSRLAVRHIGALVERGESSEAIREDYPNLSNEEIHFAHVFSRAYPKVGRPRGRREVPAR
jgi:uncharacterized protein (DUF433 family)